MTTKDDRRQAEWDKCANPFAARQLIARWSAEDAARRPAVQPRYNGTKSLTAEDLAPVLGRLVSELRHEIRAGDDALRREMGLRTKSLLAASNAEYRARVRVPVKMGRSW